MFTYNIMPCSACGSSSSTRKATFPSFRKKPVVPKMINVSPAQYQYLMRMHAARRAYNASHNFSRRTMKF